MAHSEGIRQVHERSLQTGFRKITPAQLLVQSDARFKGDPSHIIENQYPTSLFFDKLASELQHPISNRTLQSLHLTSDGPQDWVVHYTKDRAGFLAFAFPPTDMLHPNDREVQKALATVSIEYNMRGLRMEPTDICITSVAQGTILATHYRLNVDGDYEIVSVDHAVKDEDIFAGKEKESNLATMAHGIQSEGGGMAGLMTKAMSEAADGRHYFLHFDNVQFFGSLNDEFLIHKGAHEDQKQLSAWQNGVDVYTGKNYYHMTYSPEQRSSLFAIGTPATTSWERKVSRYL